MYHPWGTAGGLRPWLVSDQGYDVRVELEMPRTRANREAGNFMVELALLGPPGSSSSGTTVGSGIVGTYSSPEGMGVGGKKKNKAEEVVLAVSQRPAILTWYSDVVENVNKAIELPWYLLGWRREAERLTVGMMEGVRFERGRQNLPEALRVEIRAVERLQVYGVRVVFEAKLRGLRYGLPRLLSFCFCFFCYGSDKANIQPDTSCTTTASSPPSSLPPFSGSSNSPS